MYLVTFVWQDSSDQTVIFEAFADIATWIALNSSASDPIVFWSYDVIG